MMMCSSSSSSPSSISPTIITMKKNTSSSNKNTEFNEKSISTVPIGYLFYDLSLEVISFSPDKNAFRARWDSVWGIFCSVIFFDPRANLGVPLRPKADHYLTEF